MIGPNNYEFEDPHSGHAGYRIANPQAGRWQLVVKKMLKGPPYIYSVAVSGETLLDEVDEAGWSWTETHVKDTTFDLELRDSLFTLSTLRNPRE